jgi:hypothetical protein
VLGLFPLPTTSVQVDGPVNVPLLAPNVPEASVLLQVTVPLGCLPLVTA